MHTNKLLLAVPYFLLFCCKGDIWNILNSLYRGCPFKKLWFIHLQKKKFSILERARWRHTLELRSVGNWMVRSFWHCGVIYALTHTEVMPVQIVAQPCPSQAAAYAIVDIEIIANEKRWAPPPPHFVLFFLRKTLLFNYDLDSSS